MVRIGGSTDRGSHIKESDYYTPQGEFRIDKDGSPTLLNCLMYKMCYYRFGQVYTDFNSKIKSRSRFIKLFCYKFSCRTTSAIFLNGSLKEARWYRWMAVSREPDDIFEWQSQGSQMILLNGSLKGASWYFWMAVSRESDDIVELKNDIMMKNVVYVLSHINPKCHYQLLTSAVFYLM